MSFDIIGYHGTNSQFVASIKKENFRKSEQDNDWLGYGVYFFIEGISEPVTNAIEWARNQAYDKGKYRYERLSVLQSQILCDKDAVLNVTESEGLKAFNALRGKILEKHQKSFGFNRDIRNDNRVIWNAVAEYMELDAIIHNLYIKDCFQRRKKIDSNVPNTTVLCVKEPQSIVLNTIVEIVEEEVHNEH